tara:strand:+ start:7284 stop:7616 length:333 start_codon:yes stop_codon:yes gene_type:complete
MERFVKGDIVAVNFHFSNTKNSKRRPALVLLSLTGEDIILAEITTKFRNHPGDINLLETDFQDGKLKHKSIIRLTKLFTLNKSLISYKIGTLKPNKLNEILDTLNNLFRK